MGNLSRRAVCQRRFLEFIMWGNSFHHTPACLPFQGGGDEVDGGVCVSLVGRVAKHIVYARIPCIANNLLVFAVPRHRTRNGQIQD